jgi:hypothetical protein
MLEEVRAVLEDIEKIERTMAKIKKKLRKVV